MDNDDDDLRLRDKFAIAAMQALLTRYGGWGDYIDENEGAGPGPENDTPRTRRIALASYRIADEMRKARLKAFT